MKKRGRGALRALRMVSACLLLGAVVPAWAQAPGQASAVIDRSCDRDCLLGYVDTYLEGLASRDPSRVPFARDVIFTENNVVLPAGTHGQWRTVNRVLEGGMGAADADTGNAAWFGIVEEHGKPAYYGIRMKVVKGEITEAETLIVRNNGMPLPFADPYSVEHDPAFFQDLPESEQRSRERLIAIADGYFSTVELNDGTIFTPFHEDCGRLENGILTTAVTTGGSAGSIASGCTEQLELGIYRINKRIRERLFPLVDVERGIVVATGFFDHANTFDRYTLTDGREMRTLLKWPNSISILEAFQIKDGKIHRIEAIFTYVPYFMHNPFATPGGVGAQ